MKQCNRCFEVKSFEDFHRHSQSKDGYRPECKDCRPGQIQSEAKKKYLRDYAKTHRTEYNTYNSRYRAKAGYRKLVDFMPIKAWERLLSFYGSKCLRCGSTEALELDHIIPVSLGGQHGLWNAQVLCKSCNSSKAAHHSTDYRPSLRLVDRVIV